MKKLKCVVVGDDLVGKTSLLLSFKTKKFPNNDDEPLVFDNHTETVIIDDEPYTLDLFDTIRQEDFKNTRCLSYPQTDVFLVCFSVVDPSSHENVKEKWVPELLHHCPKVALLFVGTQIDLREDSNTLDKLTKNKKKPITPEQGEKLAKEFKADKYFKHLAKEFKAVKYVECSALTQEGVQNVFEQAVLATLRKEKKDAAFFKTIKTYY